MLLYPKRLIDAIILLVFYNNEFVCIYQAFEKLRHMDN